MLARQNVNTCTAALATALAACDGTIERAFSNAAQAYLKLREPALALGFALAVVRCRVRAPPRKALHRAAVACAALRQPQAALYFLDLVCSSSTFSTCHVSAAAGRPLLPRPDDLQPRSRSLACPLADGRRARLDNEGLPVQVADLHAATDSRLLVTEHRRVRLQMADVHT